MSDSICWLVTILYCGQLMRCAVKAPLSDVSTDCIDYPMEPENRAFIHALLPAHVGSCGPIVEVETIFEIHIVKP